MLLNQTCHHEAFLPPAVAHVQHIWDKSPFYWDEPAEALMRRGIDLSAHESSRQIFPVSSAEKHTHGQFSALRLAAGSIRIRPAERLQPLLDFAHAACQREFLAIFEHDDMFAARRWLHGPDTSQVHDG